MPRKMLIPSLHPHKVMVISHLKTYQSFRMYCFNLTLPKEYEDIFLSLSLSRIVGLE